MRNKSTYRNLININPNIKTAIIYSLGNLYTYTVEIKDRNKNYYLYNNKEELKQFGNMDDARKAAIKENVQEAYLALEKTSEETDLSTCHANHQDRYDYSFVPLKESS